MIPVFPLFEIRKTPTGFELRSRLRKKHHRKHYYWIFKIQGKTELNCFDKFIKETYFTLLLGKINPKLKIIDTPLFPEDMSEYKRESEEERVKREFYLD